MDLVDDVVGEVVNVGFDLVKENFGGIFKNMTLLNMLLLSLLTDKPFPKAKSTFDKVYDYIIVGGGTAGSVMANRLSQKPCVSVLLLEAGGYAPLLTDLPSFARVFYGTEIDWLYKTTPQKYGAFAQVDNRVNWNSGKAFGGSSVINAMIYIRGNKKNYEDWEAAGATGWSYKDVLPYFIKLENTSAIPERDLDPGYHGKNGTMTMEKPKYVPEIKPPLLEATANLGYEVRDLNGVRQTEVAIGESYGKYNRYIIAITKLSRVTVQQNVQYGIFDVQGTLRNGQRCSTAKAYLVPAEDRPNLTMLKRAFAKKILIAKNKAYGVEFDFEGIANTKRVFARKEVIISVGSVRTPQLLMLSGIGPKKELDKHKIPQVVDLPVGKNLQDHYAANLNYLLDPTIMHVVLKNLNPVNIIKYLTTRSGPIAAPNQVTLLAFLNGLNTTSTSPDFPKQELYFAESATIDALKNFNLKPEAYLQVYGKYELRSQYTCIVSLLQPESRGEILLSSTDPYEYPLINPNYFQNETDLRDMVEGLKVCQALGKSSPMKTVGSEFFDTAFPGCEKYAEDTDGDEFLGCHARSLITSFWHPVGTARMGQPNDPRSVVDPQLKVIGVSHLRVVNAAVMPTIPSGNTNVPTMMIAEKIYDTMKDDMICK